MLRLDDRNIPFASGLVPDDREGSGQARRISEGKSMVAQLLQEPLESLRGGWAESENFEVFIRARMIAP